MNLNHNKDYSLNFIVNAGRCRDHEGHEHGCLQILNLLVKNIAK